MRGLDSKVLTKRVEDVKNVPKYAALLMMNLLITQGAPSIGGSMRLTSLKAKYRKEYARLKAEASINLITRRFRGKVLDLRKP